MRSIKIPIMLIILSMAIIFWACTHPKGDFIDLKPECYCQTKIRFSHFKIEEGQYKPVYTPYRVACPPCQELYKKLPDQEKVNLVITLDDGVIAHLKEGNYIYECLQTEDGRTFTVEVYYEEAKKS